MSRALDTWYSLPDLDRLARLGRPLTGDISIGKLPRLSALLASPDGSVSATVALGHRADGRLSLELSCTATVELLCQRCLEPFSYTLTGSVDYLLADEEQAGAGVPVDEGNVELLALAGERLNPKELIEDELLVMLPFAPRHETKADCGSLARKLDLLANEFGDGGEGRTDEH